MTGVIIAPADCLHLLIGDGVTELVSAALGAAGGQALRWRIEQVDHQPGSRTTVSYAVQVRWPDGSITDEILGAVSGELPAGVARLCDGQTEVGMWRFPFDPDLPAMPAAIDADRMRRLAADIGLGDDEVRLRLRTYRPRRRAVIELATPRGTAFVKVVHPSRAQQLHSRHRVATAARCPVPASLGWTEDGLVVLAGLPGRTLRSVLTGPGSVSLDGAEVAAVLGALPEQLMGEQRRQTWGQRAPHYAEVIAAAAPELADQARAIAAAVDHGATPEGPDAPVHGDFYEKQVMVRGGRVTGLLDIDTAGRGERLDDAACLLGHLGVLAQLYPSRAGTINQFGQCLWRRFERDLDPAAMRRRTAAVVLSLATGSFRVQERDWQTGTRRRLELAQRFLNDSSCRV